MGRVGGERREIGGQVRILVDCVGSVDCALAVLVRRRPGADAVVGVAVGGVVQDGVGDLAAGVVGEGVGAALDGAAEPVRLQTLLRLRLYGAPRRKTEKPYESFPFEDVRLSTW